MYCTQCGNESTAMAAYCSQCGKQLRFEDGVRTKRLERDMANRKIAGVCAGLGNYFNLDATFVRIALLASAITFGFGFVAYLIAWIAMPKGPDARYALPAAPGI